MNQAQSNQAQSETDIIRTWINSLPVDFKKSPGLISLSEDTLTNLLQNLLNFFSSKSSLKSPPKSSSIRGNSVKYLKKGSKITLQVKAKKPGFESVLETYFYKKKVNSNWTYLQYRHYQIKWNVNIHLVSGSSKAYQTALPKKVQKKEPTERASKTLFTDYFDQESDDEN